ncbi:MAG TPA: A24 family peptidase [Rhizomicrobium sp.]|nr:A24 family peptidase [Rhizomicrobium sp.]
MSLTAWPSWIWAGLLAPFIGSFLGVLVTRYDSPASALHGRSACDACGVRLGARDMVPILSWAALRGHCRHCGAAVGFFYPLIEGAALVVALWSGLVFSGTTLWASCLLGWMLVALAAADFKYQLLPDFLSLPLIAFGLAATWALAPDNLSAHLIGAAAGFAGIVLLRFVYEKLRGREGMGLGDAKLLAAAGAWTGWIGLPSILAIAAVSALIFALWLRGRHLTLADRLPFGPFLAGGFWIVWLYGPLTPG